MLFNSFEFFKFFLILIFLYYLLPLKYRKFILLIGSYYFYSTWSIPFCLLLFGISALSYFLAIGIEKAPDFKIKKLYLRGFLVLSIGVLFTFKYFNFFSENIHLVFKNLGIHYYALTLDWLLPVGISFFTFEAISYILDVYYEVRKPEKNFFNYLLFIAYFPKLLAGPIERSNTLLPQLEVNQSLKYENLSLGFKRALWGLFKKTVIAERLSVIVDTAYIHPHEYNGKTLLIVSYLFAFQIYCDFSGYTDMAIGTSRMLGYRLMENFNLPFLSQNISDFWRRWHISLSTWLRDYIYNPVMYANKKLGNNALIIAAFITFLIAGLWHGASWTFIVFGLLQAIAISFEILTQNPRKIFQKNKFSFYKIFSIFLTFNFVVFSFIFFRSTSIQQAKNIVSSIFSLKENNLYLNDLITGVREGPFNFTIALLFIFIILDIFISKILAKEKGGHLENMVFAVILSSVLLFGIFGHSAFIYFKF